MRIWDYRVVKRTKNGQDWYGVYEVFYAENGDPEGYGDCLDAESLDELREDVALMQRALDRPVLEEADFRKVGS
jgi:hypothetical protein